MRTRRKLPSPAMLVAIVALVVGLTGSAVALQGKNSVKSNDIAPSAVKASDIHKLAVHPPALDLFKTKGVVGPLSTASKAPTDLGGPSVTVKVPQGGLVAIYARVTGQVNGGGNNASAQVHLFEPTVLPGAPAIMQFNNPSPQIRFTVPGQADTGAGGVIKPGPRRLPRVLAGEPRQVHVLAAVQQPGRRSGDLQQLGPLGRGGAVAQTAAAVESCG